MLTANSFFDLSEFDHAQLFDDNHYVWSALDNLKGYMDGLTFTSLYKDSLVEATPLSRTMVLHKDKIIDGIHCSIEYGDTTKGKLKVEHNGERLQGASVIMAGAVLMGKKIKLGKGVLIESGALVKSPAVLGDMTEVRQGAYLRGYCLAGKNCVIGHTTEVKHSIFLNHAKAGHFAYLGDSILGGNANLGAGTKFANLRFLPGNVSLRIEGELIDTGRRKIGAILGDNVQTGCNTVTSPGTLLGKDSMAMPNTTVKAGYHPPRTVQR